jgi:hypothetical protein
MACYEEILSTTSPRHAPWFVIPADHKWFRNIAISHVLVETLTSLKLKYPPPPIDPAGIRLDEESLKSAEKKAAKRRNKHAIELDSQTVTYGKT